MLEIIDGMRTSIRSHGEISVTAEEIYGKGDIILRVGNGGAGATGLIAALANDYLSTFDHKAAISWVCNHSRNTQLALLENDIDLALTYERDQEELAINEGWAISAGCVFHDHFCLAGPVDDPAGVKKTTDIFEAFRRIATTRSKFHSRADFSATMIKERSIWERVNLKPWESHKTDGHDWYVQTLYSPAKALEVAAENGAYLLTDRSTLLRQTSLGTIKSVTVFFEPDSAKSVLMNDCYATYSSSTTPQKTKDVKLFIQYLLSVRGQNVIASFGEDEVGLPLFTQAAEGYSRSSIVGGQPLHGRWARVQSHP